MATDPDPEAVEKRSGRHVIRGEYRYRGSTYCEYFPQNVLEQIPSFTYRHDDVLLATYPKSGTTWLQEIVYGVVHEGDIEHVKHVPRKDRLPFIEISLPGYMHGLQQVADLPDTKPRIIKTHLHREYFDRPINQNIKIVVGMRNVKDVIVSYYHFYKFIEVFEFNGEFDEFFELFREKNLCHGDYFDWNLNWWKERDNRNVLFVNYEDMKEDIARETRRVCDFLGKNLSKEAIDKIIDSSSFGKMKTRQMEQSPREKEGVGQLRKGIVGDWKNHFNDEQRQYIESRIENELAGTGLDFKYD